MTEAEWFQADNPIPMLDFLGRKASNRKLRLFACACLRHLFGERLSDGLRKRLFACERLADGLIKKYPSRWPDDYETWHLDFRHPKLELSWRQIRKEKRAQAQSLRCIFGNPFRTARFDPAWRFSSVTQVAEAIYADRTFDRLPILADALEDAGCTDADILNHLRQPGEHVRGCWALDLILSKDR